MSTPHPDDLFMRQPDVATAPDYEIPRPQIKTPHTGEYAERISWAYPIKTDGSGNYQGSVYDVRFGYKLTPIRLTIADPAGTYTPAAPYANAACWLGLFPDDAGFAALSDFGPTVAGGPVIPGMFAYSEDAGMICRQFLGLKIVTGPASFPLMVNGIGILREA